MSETATDTSYTLVDTFLRELERESVTYCLLGAEQTDWTDGDVDLWVAPGEQTQARQTLGRVVDRHQWTVVRANQSPRLTDDEGKYLLFHPDDPDGVVHLDLWTHLYWRGITYLDSTVVAETRREIDAGYTVAHPEVEAAESVVGDLLHGRRPTAADRRQASAVLDAGTDVFVSVLEPGIGREAAMKLAEWCLDDDWESIAASRSKIRQTLVRRRLSTNLVEQLHNWARYVSQGVDFRLRRDHGLSIAFVGPDGAGKTTLIEELFDSEFAERGVERRYRWYRDFPILPKLGEIAASVGLGSLSTSQQSADETTGAEETTATTETRDTEPLTTSRAWIYPVYYALNDALGRGRLWRLKKDGGALVLFDRYFYEFEIQRTYDNCPEPLITLCRTLVPEPDLLVNVTADPETIYERRAELSPDEIRRQLRVCEELAADHDRTVTADTEDSVQQSLTRVYRAAVEYLGEEST